MILILFILCIIATIVPLYLEYKDKSPFFFLFAILGMLVFMPLLFSKKYIETTIIYALLFYIICNAFYVFTLLILRKIYDLKKRAYKINVFPFNNYGHTDKLVYLCIIALIGLLIFSGSNLNVILSSSLRDKRELGGTYLILLFLVGFISPFILYALKRKKYLMFVAILICFSLILLFFRSRSILSFALFPIAYYIFFWVKKGKKYLLVFGVLIFLLSLSLKAVRYKGELSQGLQVSVLTEDLPNLIERDFNEGVGDLFVGKVYYDVVRDGGEHVDWFGGFSIPKKIISIVVPGYNEKKTIEYQLWDYYFQPGMNGSLHPTGYGVAYADFGGIWGVLLFISLAFVRMFVHAQILKTKDVRLLGFIMYFVLFFARGSVYNSIVFLMVPCVIWILLRSGFKLYKEKV